MQCRIKVLKVTPLRGRFLESFIKSLKGRDIIMETNINNARKDVLTIMEIINKLPRKAGAKVMTQIGMDKNGKKWVVEVEKEATYMESKKKLKALMSEYSLMPVGRIKQYTN